MFRTLPTVTAIVFAFVSFGVVHQVLDTPTVTVRESILPALEQEAVTVSNDEVLKFPRSEVLTIAAPPTISEPGNLPRTGGHLPSAEGGMARINQIMTQYGVYAHPATQFHIGSLPLECQPAHACVIQDGLGKIDFYMLPDQITPYLVIHEIAHTQGILDECVADNFTAKYVGHRGSYC